MSAPPHCRCEVWLLLGWLLFGGATGARAGSQLSSLQRTSETTLQFGEPGKTGKAEAVIPLNFIPAEGQATGEIRAEVVMPPGPWRFRKLEVPKGSPWNARARQRTEETKGTGGENLRLTILVLQISAVGRQIPAGRIGILRFSLERPDSPLPDSLTVRELATWPPEPEARREESAFPLPSEDPSINPATGCFFFTH